MERHHCAHIISCLRCPLPADSSSTVDFSRGRKRRRRRALALVRQLNTPIFATAMATQSPLLCSSSGAPCAKRGHPSTPSDLSARRCGFSCCVANRLSSIALHLYFLRSDRLSLDSCVEETEARCSSSGFQWLCS